MAIGVPGCPDFAVCTASIESVRMVLMVRRWRSVEGMAGENNLTANMTRIESGRAMSASP